MKALSILMFESSILIFSIDWVNFQVFYLTSHKRCIALFQLICYQGGKLFVLLK